MPQPVTISPSELLGVRVLAVDDTSDALELLVTVLKVYGATVTPATSVREALALYAREPQDVVVSDIRMQQEDGYALLRGVRAAEAERKAPRARAVALTGMSDPSSRERALEAGFDAHLTKPFDPDDLVAAIAALVQA
jgi:CheY-like chemotaxis protein